MTLYADDVTMGYIDRPTQAQAIHASLQKSLALVSRRLTELELSFSQSKTSSLLYRRRGRLPSSRPPLFLEGHKLKRLINHRQLGFPVADHLTWRPTVTDAVTSGRRVAPILRKLNGESWGGGQGTVILIYRGLFISSCLYALPLLTLSTAR